MYTVTQEKGTTLCKIDDAGEREEYEQGGRLFTSESSPYEPPLLEGEAEEQVAAPPWRGIRRFEVVLGATRGSRSIRAI